MEELRKEFELWGWKWETCMEGGRPLHPSDPRYYINKNNVIVNLIIIIFLVATKIMFFVVQFLFLIHSL